MTKKISLSKSMPLTVGLVCGTFVAGYMLSALNAEFEIGRPSSTAAIGYIFVPIYAGIVALIGVGIGFILKAVLKGRGEQDKVSLPKYLFATTSILLLSWFFAANIGIKQVEEFEDYNKPKLLSNTGKFVKTSLNRDVAPTTRTYAKLVWDFERESIEPILLANGNAQAKVINSTLLKIIFKNAKSLSYDVSNYSYITEVSALNYPSDAKNDSYLVVLVRLRATSFRSIILIYNQEHQLVYEELLDRCGRKQYLGTVDTIDGEGLIVNLCSPFILTKPNKAPQPTPKSGAAEL